MNRFLVVVGVQPEKIKLVKGGDKLVKWIQTHQQNFDSTIAVVRKDQNNRNFAKADDTIANKLISNLDYSADTIIEVGGYDLDCKQFRKDAEYIIVGISTGSAVLTSAMSMYSEGLNVKVVKDLCLDRKGLHKEAIKIMEAYMPGCVI